MISDLDIIDNHVHCFERDKLDALLDDLRYTGAKQFVFLVTQRDDDPQGEFANALLLKQRLPQEAFVFGGLDFRGMVEQGGGRPAVAFERQVQDLMEMGCDGLKLLMGKPDRRKAMGAALDDPVFTPMLSLLEQTQFPVLWHVADPPEFWSEQTVPLWARQRGWWYSEDTPSKAQIDAEIARVFERHPKLNLILPHFFFHSDRLEDAAKLLDDHPSYNLDLAPGVEMFHNFTANHAASREFFIRYADRILFGTDFGMDCGWHRDRGNMIRWFLETSNTFEVPQDPAMQPDERPALRGIELPREALKNIYVDNFRRVVGGRPRPLRGA